MPNSTPDYPEHLQAALPFIEAFRKALIRIIIVTVVLAIGGYYCAEPLLRYLQGLTGAKLVAYGLSDSFFAFLQLAMAIGFTAGLPYTLYALLVAITAVYPNLSRKAFFGFWAAGVGLFGLGILFCVKLTLPYGIQFLLGYETTRLVALISVKTFVAFCFWVIFGFGLIFELPLVMMLLGRLGVLEAKKIAGYRRYAIVAILIIAAVITPTPDIFNLLLMAGPLYLLFEIGLIGMRVWGKKRS